VNKTISDYKVFEKVYTKKPGNCILMSDNRYLKNFLKKILLENKFGPNSKIVIIDPSD